MQENTWARLRDLHPGKRAILTQPSPYIFLHFCIWSEYKCPTDCLSVREWKWNLQRSYSMNMNWEWHLGSRVEKSIPKMASRILLFYSLWNAYFRLLRVGWIARYVEVRDDECEFRRKCSVVSCARVAAKQQFIEKHCKAPLLYRYPGKGKG